MFEALEARQLMSGTPGADAAVGSLIQPKLIGPGLIVPGPIAMLPTDFGDAPNANYRTLLANNGARHVILPGFFLGNGVDAEPNGQPTVTALGDDTNGADDENGVNLPASFVPGNAYVIQVKASAPGVLDAWVDWNRNMQFDAGPERIAAGVALAAGINNVVVNVPAGAVIGGTYARFRFSMNGVALPYGPGGWGEVEDYHTAIAQPGGGGGGGGGAGGDDIGAPAARGPGGGLFGENPIARDVLASDTGDPSVIA